MHFDAVISEGVSKFKGVRMPGESSNRAPGPKAYSDIQTYRVKEHIHVHLYRYRDIRVKNSNTMYSRIRKCEQSHNNKIVSVSRDR